MRTSAPILHSALEDDLYKLTMLYFIWKNFRGVPVTFGFTNRSIKVPLVHYIPIEELRAQLEHARQLVVTEAEADFIRKGAGALRPGFFPEEFITFLRSSTLPEISVEEKPDGQYHIEASGSWEAVTRWEIRVLQIVSTLYFDARRVEDGLSEAQVFAEGERRLLEKVAVLRQHPEIRFVDFGTRRAFSPRWHRHVVEMLLAKIPSQLAATSNMRFAMDLGIKSNGTNAHELYMALSLLFGDLPEQVRWSFLVLLRLWWNMYGKDLAVVLTDTYGSEFCFRMMTKAWAEQYRALRHDSGDPIAFGERAIRFYQGHEIDPATKTLIFSDGLTLELILKLHQHFLGRINTAFGWGTTLTNDVGFKTLSLVMKATRVNGQSTVKLSDNPAKMQGPPEAVARMIEIHEYTEGAYQECQV